jgi:hypothetical protein
VGGLVGDHAAVGAVMKRITGHMEETYQEEFSAGDTVLLKEDRTGEVPPWMLLKKHGQLSKMHSTKCVGRNGK